MGLAGAIQKGWGIYSYTSDPMSPTPWVLTPGIGLGLQGQRF